MNPDPTATFPESNKQMKLLGHVMLDRSLLALVVPIALIVLHAYFALSIYFRPRLAIISLVLGLLVICSLWFRAASAVFKAWGDSSAKIVRYTSVGALLLSFLLVATLLFITLWTPDSD